jgi:hypothetical protein
MVTVAVWLKSPRKMAESPSVWLVGVAVHCEHNVEDYWMFMDSKSVCARNPLDASRIMIITPASLHIWR